MLLFYAVVVGDAFELDEYGLVTELFDAAILMYNSLDDDLDCHMKNSDKQKTCVIETVAFEKIAYDRDVFGACQCVEVDDIECAVDVLGVDNLGVGNLDGENPVICSHDLGVSGMSSIGMNDLVMNTQKHHSKQGD